MRDSNDATTTPDYATFWGDDAKVAAVAVRPRGLITVPERFVRGPLLNIVQRKVGAGNRDAIKTFCEDALLAWYEKYRERRARAPPERLDELLALIPTPAPGESLTRIEINLDAKIKDEAFGRVLASRFRANGEGRSLAIREAILEALLAAKGT